MRGNDQQQTPLDKDTVLRVGNLAGIALSEAEIEAFREELAPVLDYVRKLNTLPLNDDDDSSLPLLSPVNVFRADECTPSLDKERILSQAPKRWDNYFQIPRILE